MTHARDASRIARTGIPTAENAQALRDLISFSTNPPEAVQTLGAVTAGDGGGGLWRWDAVSTDADNLGTVLLPTGSVVAGRWVREIGGSASLQWFGCVADGATDDTAAIQAAFDWSVTSDVPIVDSGREYGTTGAITILQNCNLTGCKFNVTPFIGSAIVVGYVGSANLLWSKRITLPDITVVGATTGDWTGIGDGVQISNANTCEITIGEVRHFDSGILLSADNGQGNVYHTITLGLIWANKIGLNIQSPYPYTGGWVTECLFIGGRWQSAPNPTVPTETRFILITAGASNHCFIKPALEDPSTDVDQRIHHIIECYGYKNTWISPRFETGSRAAGAETIAMRDNVLGTKNADANAIFKGVWADAVTTITEDPGCSANSYYRDDNVNISSDLSAGALKLYNSGGSSVVIHSNKGEWLEYTPVTTDSLRISATAIQRQNSADTAQRINMDFSTGKITLSDGVTASSMGIEAVSTSSVQHSGSIVPNTSRPTSYQRLGNTGGLEWDQLFVSKARFTGLSTYADDAAAGAGGLVATQMYQTATGELRIKL